MGDKSVGVLRGVGPTKIGGGRGPSLDESGSPAVCDSLNERSFEFCKFIAVSYTHLTLPTNREV